MKDVERKEVEEDLTQVTNSSPDSNPHHNSMLLMPVLLEITVQKSRGAEKCVQERTAQICAKLSLQHHPFSIVTLILIFYTKIRILTVKIRFFWFQVFRSLGMSLSFGIK